MDDRHRARPAAPELSSRSGHRDRSGRRWRVGCGGSGFYRGELRLRPDAVTRSPLSPHSGCMSSRGRDDGELLAACANDPEAFADFYRRHSRAIFAYFMSRLHRSDLAADLTGEVFALAFEGVRDGRVIGNPRGG